MKKTCARSEKACVAGNNIGSMKIASVLSRGNARNPFRFFSSICSDVRKALLRNGTKR